MVNNATYPPNTSANPADSAPQALITVKMVDVAHSMKRKRMDVGLENDVAADSTDNATFLVNTSVVVVGMVDCICVLLGQGIATMMDVAN